MSTMPAWLSQIAQSVKAEVPKEFVGQLEINLFKGGISSVNVRETFKCDDLKK